MVIASLTVIVLVCEHCMMKLSNEKERDRYARLTVVHTDCIAVVSSDISYVSVTPVAEL